MKRIVIIGTSGCGKTTLAKKLGKIINIPYYDMDDYYWLPNWVVRDSEEFPKIIDAITQNPSWIICGNYSKVNNITWEKADTIIWLDYNIFRCLYQALKRSVKNIIYSRPLCGGNYENIRHTFFSKKSIILWILTTYKKRKATYTLAFNNQIPNKTYLRFNNPNKTRVWLNKI
ncbi:MAG: AAA family ATPase [Sphingobacteriia bacterium]|nr:AAA family ATPase [Sphingobacteriia bacterium]